MTRPKRSNAPKGARGHAPKKMVAQGRGGTTRDSTRPVREPTSREPDSGERRTTEGRSSERRSSDSRPRSGSSAGGGSGSPRRYGSASAGEGSSRGGAKSGARPGAAKSGSCAGSKAADTKTSGSRSAEGRSTGGKATGNKSTGSRTGSASGASNASSRAAPPRVYKKKALPELKRVQLDAPDPDTAFRDRDGQRLTFPDSNLRRVAAQILTEKNKAWRYRPFSFPLFTDRGSEQSFNFDFYIYDAEDSVIRLILVVPHESREVWDRVGRFKRQYPMYTYELWTPEKLAQLSGPRGRLGF